jgi:hypothetical protein
MVSNKNNVIPNATGNVTCVISSRACRLIHICRYIIINIL